MGRDKRGIRAKFLQRELGVAYQTAWTMAHKLRHGLSEDPSRPLHGFLEADETFRLVGRLRPWSDRASRSQSQGRRCRRPVSQLRDRAWRICREVHISLF
jgi:hypothetical protein